MKSLEGPPGFFLGAGRGVTVVGGIVIVHLTGTGLVDEMTPLLATGDHAIDGAPVGKATYIAVVDKEVCLQLTREVRVVVGGLLGIVAVGSIELHTALAAPLDGIVQELALTAGPEHQAMTIGNEHLQGLSGEGTLLADFGIFILDDGSVEINGYYHKLMDNG